MPSWKNIGDEVGAAGSAWDIVRRNYLAKLHDRTGRNVIIYYSGWLQKGHLEGFGIPGFGLDDSDKNGFMAAVYNLDRSKGLDLLLHTPGGEVAATESIVDYLRSMFGTDIRAIIPQLAMSAGTMIACSCKEIIMGKQSSLGPIDPQIGGLAAHGIIEEFERAATEITADQRLAYVWQPIIAKYTPTLIGECQKAIQWSNEMVKDWLVSGMFSGHVDANDKAERVIAELGDHALTRAHSRHIAMSRAASLGLKIVALEDDHELQDAVLSVHHACVHTLQATPAFKIIENHKGLSYIPSIQIITSGPGAQVVQPADIQVPNPPTTTPSGSL